MSVAAIRDIVREVLGTTITRAKVVSSQILNGRTVLQVNLLDGSTKTAELNLPPGHVARPVDGADVTLFLVAGGQHGVALGGDNTTETVPNVAAGERGISDGIQYIMLRNGSMQIISPYGLVVTVNSMTLNNNALVNGNLAVSTGATGTFSSADGKVITVQDGIITNIY